LSTPTIDELVPNTTTRPGKWEAGTHATDPSNNTTTPTDPSTALVL
jgi:hypothetical protein